MVQSKIFLIKLNQKGAVLSYADKTISLASDRTFSENLLPAIDRLLQKTNQPTPSFKTVCRQGANVISCNVARATASALNL